MNQFEDFLSDLDAALADALPAFRAQNPDMTDDQLRQWLLQCLDEKRRNAMN